MPPLKDIVTDYVILPLLVVACGLGALVLIAATLAMGAATTVFAGTVAILARHAGIVALAAAVAFAAWTVAPLLEAAIRG